MKKIDADTRFYIDLDLKSKTIIGWDYGHRQDLNRELSNPNQRRIFLSKGQYNKLDK